MEINESLYRTFNVDYYDGQFNGNLKRLGKMVRAWKTKMTVLMPGILIDTISYHFLSQYQYATSSFVYYDWISRDFFKYLMDNKDKHSWSKFGSGELVDVKYSDSIFSDSKNDRVTGNAFGDAVVFFMQGGYNEEAT